MLKHGIRLLSLISPWLWPIRIPVPFTGEPPTANVSIADGRTGDDPTPYTFEVCEAHLTLSWEGGRANVASIRAVSDQNPLYSTTLFEWGTQSQPVLPVTSTGGGKVQADAALVTAIGILIPGDYHLEGTSYRLTRVPFFGTVTRGRHTLTSAPFELPREPTDRCAA